MATHDPQTGSQAKVRVAVVGTGGMARYHIRRMLQQTQTTTIPFVCEPAPAAYSLAAALFTEAGLEPPVNVPDLDRLLAGHAKELDAALIVSPHVYHHGQAVACMEHGLDVLLEKPMVMNAAEAYDLIATRDRTGRLLTVAFQGSLSPQIRTAAKMLRSGELGVLLGISGVVWQGWGPGTAGTWRQQPELSGGGFMFDTGAHMLNTVSDLAGEEFVEVAAWLDNYGRLVDTRAAVMGRLASGAYVTLHGCGETIPGGHSHVHVFCTRGVLHAGVWGERLELQRHGAKALRKVKLPPSLGPWEQFLAVRGGKMDNPCPPEVGLRMAKLWDAIKASAAQGGARVSLV